MKFAIPAALVLAVVVAVSALAEPPSPQEAAENLRRIGQAMRMYADATTQPYPHARFAVTRPADVEAVLDRRLPEVRFEETGIKDALAFLGQAGGVNIDVNWKALKEIEVAPADRVSLQAHNIRLERSLSLVLAQLGNGKACFDVDDTVIRISTESDLADLAEVRIYTVRDLIDSFLAAHQAEPIHWVPGGVPTTAPADDAGPVGAGLGGGWNQQLSPYTSAVSQLVKVISDTVARDEWVDNGGQIGSIHEFAGKLVIKTTPRNHRQVAELLAKLREAK